MIDLKDEGLRLWFQISDLKFEISEPETLEHAACKLFRL